MSISHTRWWLFACLFSLSLLAQAMQFNGLDARSMALGGTGVAIPSAATAPFYNPAMLALQSRDSEYRVDLFNAGARFFDPDNFKKRLDDFQDKDYLYQLETRLRSYDMYHSTHNLQQVWYTLQDMQGDLDGNPGDLSLIANNEVHLELAASTLLSHPDPQLGFAVYYGQWGEFREDVRYTDAETLSEFFEDVDFYLFCDLLSDSCNPYDRTYVDAEGNITFDPDTDLSSTLALQGLIVKETGVSLAHQLTIAGYTLAVGITPKHQSVDVYEYHDSLFDGDLKGYDQGSAVRHYSNMNLDLGLGILYKEHWRGGLMLKNLQAQRYKTVADEIVHIPMQVRIGGSFQNAFSTVAVDYDLSSMRAIDRAQNEQFLAFSGELDTADWVQIRTGYRMNLADSRRNVLSAGIGMEPMGSHLDFALAKQGEEYGLALNLGFQF